MQYKKALEGSSIHNKTTIQELKWSSKMELVILTLIVLKLNLVKFWKYEIYIIYH